jgi:hypothetical protein
VKERKMLWDRWFSRSTIVVAGVLAFGSVLLAADDSTRTSTTKPEPLMSSHSTTATSQGEYFVLEVRHRVFADFHEIDTVEMNKQFSIGEGDDVGEVFVFNPHFNISDSGRVLQLSDTLYNPAVRVRVTQKDSVIQESWAFFYGSMPHFRRNDLLGFRLLSFHVSDKYIPAQGPKMPVMKPADSTATVNKK